MKYVFTTDGDGHWFLIPEELSSKFNQMLEEGESDYYASFCNYFEQYASDNPRNLTFIKSEDGTLHVGAF